MVSCQHLCNNVHERLYPTHCHACSKSPCGVVHSVGGLSCDCSCGVDCCLVVLVCLAAIAHTLGVLQRQAASLAEERCLLACFLAGSSSSSASQVFCQAPSQEASAAGEALQHPAKHSRPMSGTSVCLQHVHTGSESLRPFSKPTAQMARTAWDSR